MPQGPLWGAACGRQEVSVSRTQGTVSGSLHINTVLAFTSCQNPRPSQAKHSRLSSLGFPGTRRPRRFELVNSRRQPVLQIAFQAGDVVLGLEILDRLSRLIERNKMTRNAFTLVVTWNKVHQMAFDA